MAKIRKRSLDSIKRAPVRRQSYTAPALRRKKKVPKEYQTLKKASGGGGSFLWFLFLLFLATLMGFIYFNNQEDTVLDNSLLFSVTGPDKIISGDQAIYVIEYNNIDDVVLQQVELNVQWSNGFYFDESSIEPMDQNATTWLLEDLAPGRSGRLEIKGELVGQQDEILNADFSLTYQPANFHSDFKANQTVTTQIKDSKIEILFEAVDKTLVGTEQNFRMTYKNISGQTLEALYLDILYPDDFLITENTEPADEASDENTEKIIDADVITDGKYLVFSLAPDEERVIEIVGAFSVDSAVDQLWVVEVGNMVDEKFRRLSRIEKPILVVNPKFDIDFKINGKSTVQKLNWGDTLQYQLEITNRSGADINDVEISAMIDSELLDWDSLDTIGVQKDNKVIWTKKEVEDLAVWASEESKVFTLRLEVIDNPQVTRTIESIIKINIEGLDDWQQITAPLLLTVGESISFNNGIYWDLGGRRVGSGLLPPQANEKTEYLVIWSLPEATGLFDKVDIATTLPPEVNFIEAVDMQPNELEFDLETRSIIWHIENFQDLILPSTASYYITLTPENSNIGEVMTLLNSTTVTAQGAEEIIVRSKSIKTSDVVADTTEPIGIVQ